MEESVDVAADGAVMESDAALRNMMAVVMLSLVVSDGRAKQRLRP